MESSQKDGGPAFPGFKYWDDGSVTGSTNGTSLRDYFAGQALAGLLAANATYGGRTDQRDKLAGDAYGHADAMLKAREGDAS